MKGGLATFGLASLSLPMWALPVLAQGETVVQFLDFPANFNPNPRPGSRFFDTRKIDNFITPADEYYTFQHFAQPMVDSATFATPGEHTVVSRATDINGQVQPAVTHPSKKTIWENPEQMIRRVMIR